MATRIVVGAQWGDEGKGKMVDYLAQNADLIVRYQGGDNAGHTVVNDKGVFKLHLIPCGIFTTGARLLRARAWSSIRTSCSKKLPT